MTNLLQAACADVREAASYAPKESIPMSSNNPFPSAGDSVHYIDDSAAHGAAIVLHVKGEHARRLWLRVLGHDLTDYERHWVEQGDERGTWHWPERSAPQQNGNELRAQAEPGPQRDYEADIAILKARYHALDQEKIEFCNLYRDATDRADRLWRLVAMLQDMLDAKEAGL